MFDIKKYVLIYLMNDILQDKKMHPLFFNMQICYKGS